MKARDYGKITAHFTQILLIVFVILELTKLITWPWLWVLSPFWMPLLISLLLLAIIELIKLFKDINS